MLLSWFLGWVLSDAAGVCYGYWGVLWLLGCAMVTGVMLWLLGCAMVTGPGIE